MLMNTAQAISKALAGLAAELQTVNYAHCTGSYDAMLLQIQKRYTCKHVSATTDKYMTECRHGKSWLKIAHLYCCDPRDVRGVNPTMKKCRRGNGIRLTANFLKSELS